MTCNTIKNSVKTALLIVDVQNDFLPPDGKLAVQNGRDILPQIIKLLDTSKGWPWAEIVVSQDYHPSGHVSFATSHPGYEDKVFRSIKVKTPAGQEIDQILWPEHCIQGTSGCEIEESVQKALVPWQSKGLHHLVQKGSNQDLDAYSAFANPAQPSPNSTDDSPLALHLQGLGATRLVICGIATDVCVKATAEDALKCGFEIVILKEACKGVDEQAVGRTLNWIAARENASIVDDFEELWEILLK